MPESRLERTRKAYAELMKPMVLTGRSNQVLEELSVNLPDTSKPFWWTEEYAGQLLPNGKKTDDKDLHQMAWTLHNALK